VEVANLKAKREIIAKLGEITAETPREEAIAALRELQNQWQQIGHVPFREKDKVYEAYRAKVDELRSSLDLKESRARMDRYRSTVAEIEDDDNKLYRERERLLRNADAKRNELRTYENNLGFLSSKSKTGDSMMREFNRKIERIKADIATLEEQIRLIDSKLQ
jgi:chromosome segregation ATPase